jgi:hypothetical protein
MNQIVARFTDGSLTKGFTSDFLPNKDLFHLTPADAGPGAKPLEVRLTGLKAVFFVKDFAGDPHYQDRQDFDAYRIGAGRKLRVRFRDGEVLVGTTQGYLPGRPGFFLIPADPKSNIERCYVVTAATTEVSFV